MSLVLVTGHWSVGSDHQAALHLGWEVHMLAWTHHHDLKQLISFLLRVKCLPHYFVLGEKNFFQYLLAGQGYGFHSEGQSGISLCHGWFPARRQTISKLSTCFKSGLLHLRKSSLWYESWTLSAAQMIKMSTCLLMSRSGYLTVGSWRVTGSLFLPPAEPRRRKQSTVTTSTETATSTGTVCAAEITTALTGQSSIKPHHPGKNEQNKAAAKR